MRPAALLSVFLLLSVLTLGQAQIVVPTFGTRGEVPAPLGEQLMSLLRSEVERQTGLSVDEGDLIKAGIASSLDASYTYLIAQLGEGRYALSGEIRRVASGGSQAPYTLSILMADEEAQLASDVISEPFSEATMSEVVVRLAGEVATFVTPAGLLETGEGELFISSQPGEAQVFINGVAVGETSTLDVLELQPGSYDVELRKEGFLPATRTVNLREGQPEFVNIVLTALVGGSVQVSSVPSAQLLVDGEVQGRTPLTVRADPGTRTITLQRPGFETLSVEVPVQDYRINRVNQTLTPIFGRMLYWDEDVLLSVDGVLRSGGFSADIGPGTHRIEGRSGGRSYAFVADIPAEGVFRVDLVGQRLVPLGE